MVDWNEVVTEAEVPRLLGEHPTLGFVQQSVNPVEPDGDERVAALDARCHQFVGHAGATPGTLACYKPPCRGHDTTRRRCDRVESEPFDGRAHVVGRPADGPDDVIVAD